jgi:AraC family transcriptional regulator
MGAHAFTGEPAHCGTYRRRGASLPRLFGIEARWNMPGARHRRTLGPEARFDGVDHYVVTLHVGGAVVRRLDAAGAAPAQRRGAVSLQRPGSGGTFASSGPVDYAHLYFRQSLLCEIADEAGRPESPEIDDVFGLVSPQLSQAVETYVGRALDADDPAFPIEMDSRAYLLGDRLLRMLGAPPPAPRALSADALRLRPALEMIEDRLSDPIRLTDLAAAVGLSPFHFARLFTATFGEPPARWLMRRRVERAVELIRTTPEPLSQIAYRTGFSSQAHMSRRVKHALGRSPGVIRRDR